MPAFRVTQGTKVHKIAVHDFLLASWELQFEKLLIRRYLCKKNINLDSNFYIKRRILGRGALLKYLWKINCNLDSIIIDYMESNKQIFLYVPKDTLNGVKINAYEAKMASES